MQTNYLLQNQGFNNNLNDFDNKNNDVMAFAEILCELSRYNSDLKAILENSKLSANQNQNEEILYASNDEEIQNTFLNNVDSNHTNEFKTIQDPNDKVNVENPDGDKKSNTDNTQDVSKNNANISENNPVTADSIYNLLTSQYVIIVDVSKLPESLKQIVNKLTNNNDLNNPNLNMDSNDQNNKGSVALNASQFQELIYYFIINAVAKDRGMSVLPNQNQNNQTYDSTLQTIQTMKTNFGSSDNNGAYQAYDRYRKYINTNIDTNRKYINTNIDTNGNLQASIENELNQQGISINFWGPFLWDVLKRASFSYSLYKAIRNNHRKDKIDAVLGLPHVLFILSLIFGWGAIASTILGLAVLASLLYKAINQYQQARPKYLLDSLLRTKTFYAIAKGLDRALVPEVGNLYKFYSKGAEYVQNQQRRGINNFQQYPLTNQSQYPTNPFGYQNPNL